MDSFRTSIVCMSVNGWIECTVADIAAPMPNALATGPFGSAISARFFQESGVPVIRGSNLSESVEKRLVDDDLVFVSVEKARDFRRSVVKKGDLVFTCWGTIGQVGLIDDRCPYDEYVISNKQMKLTPDPEKADSLFLYYLFSGGDVSRQIKSQRIGSSVPGFNLGQLRSIRLTIPSVSEQRAIAHVLGTLDDKIELNRRMNETLEATAQALFKSWFIDPTRNGLLEGWREGTLGEVAENTRRTLEPDQIDPTTPYIGLEHIPRRSIALSEWGISGELESNKFAFKRGEILFGKLRPYFHKVGVAPIDGVCSTDILVVRPKEPDWFGFVLGHVSSVELVNHTDAASTGTKMPRTNWNDIARYEVALPPERRSASLNERITPLIERIIANIHESRTLAALRDALLPKLMSGELRVPRSIETA